MNFSPGPTGLESFFFFPSSFLFLTNPSFSSSSYSYSHSSCSFFSFRSGIQSVVGWKEIIFLFVSVRCVVIERRTFFSATGFTMAWAFLKKESWMREWGKDKGQEPGVGNGRRKGGGRRRKGIIEKRKRKKKKIEKLVPFLTHRFFSIFFSKKIFPFLSLSFKPKLLPKPHFVNKVTISLLQSFCGKSFPFFGDENERSWSSELHGVEHLFLEFLVSEILYFFYFLQAHPLPFLKVQPPLPLSLFLRAPFICNNAISILFCGSISLALMVNLLCPLPSYFWFFLFLWRTRWKTNSITINQGIKTCLKTFHALPTDSPFI